MQQQATPAKPRAIFEETHCANLSRLSLPKVAQCAHEAHNLAATHWTLRWPQEVKQHPQNPCLGITLARLQLFQAFTKASGMAARKCGKYLLYSFRSAVMQEMYFFSCLLAGSRACSNQSVGHPYRPYSPGTFFCAFSAGAELARL